MHALRIIAYEGWTTTKHLWHRSSLVENRRSLPEIPTRSNLVFSCQVACLPQRYFITSRSSWRRLQLSYTRIGDECPITARSCLCAGIEALVYVWEVWVRKNVSRAVTNTCLYVSVGSKCERLCASCGCMRGMVLRILPTNDYVCRNPWFYLLITEY